MSYSTMNQNGQSGSGYGGGKSSPPIDNDFGRGEMINQYGIPGDPQRAQYQGGPPKLDLSGMMPQTPAQKVAESQAGGGILKLRQPQPFNPNPTPNPGFGGGKGMIPGIGGQPGFGGGKGIFNPTLPPGAEYGPFQQIQNQVPTKTYGQY